MKTKDLALQLSQDLGLRIFPCYPRGHEREKQPMVNHWKESASTTEGVILRWFGGRVDKLIAVLMEGNGYFAVDVDTPEAAAIWAGWCKEYGMPEPCPWQKTPRGAHYIFKLPENIKIPNNAGKLAIGIDLRAAGYICTGGEGSGYEWQVPLSEGIPEAPDWLLQKIKAITTSATTERTAPTTEPPLNPDLTAEYWLKYYAEKAAVGTRNECAYKMGLQLYYAGIPLADALDLWIQWHYSIPDDPTNRFTQGEYVRTIKSAYSGIQREAATLPREAVIEQKPVITAPVKSEPKVEATKPPEPQKAPKKEGKSTSKTKPKVEEIEALTELNYSTWADLDEVLAPIEWEWPLWLSKGFLHIVVGMTGEGKSKLALRIAGVFLVGLDWPDGTPYEEPTACVVWCEAEAGQAMNRDRAKAMKLPTDKILSPLDDPLDDFRLNNAVHLAKLAYMASLPEVKLIVVDSLSGADPTAEKSTEDAKNVNWLAGLARDTQKPVILTHHLRKRGLFDIEGEVSLDRVRGISTILQYARVIWAIDTPNLEDRDTKRLSVIKSNLAKKPEPIGFVIDDDITFTDAPSRPKIETLQDKGVDLLLNLLSKGAAPATTIEQEFDGAGLSKRTMREAKKVLQVVSIKQPGKGWLWSLPTMLDDNDD